MAVNLSDKNESQEFNDINITPFVDVVLVLLVILMVTAPIMMKTVIDLKLPSVKNVDQTKQINLGITILKSGNLMLNGTLLSPEQLEEEIKRSLIKDPKTQVIIIADKMATHGMVIELIDLVKGAGANNFAFQVEKKKK